MVRGLDGVVVSLCRRFISASVGASSCDLVGGAVIVDRAGVVLGERSPGGAPSCVACAGVASAWSCGVNWGVLEWVTGDACCCCLFAMAVESCACSWWGSWCGNREGGGDFGLGVGDGGAMSGDVDADADAAGCMAGLGRPRRLRSSPI